MNKESEVKEPIVNYIFDGPKEVKIKPAGKVGYFGISSYAGSVTVLGAELSKNGHNTGLSEIEEAYYEKKLKLDPGTLNRHSEWWDNVFNVKHNLRLHNTKTTEFLLDNPINQIRYKVMMASTKIANTEIEKIKPTVMFFISDDEAKARKELESVNYEFEGMGLIHKASPEEKRENLRLFGKKGLDDMTETMLNVELVRELKKDPKTFIETLNDKDIKTKAFILELLEKGLLKRKGNYYLHGEDTIANSTEECVDYFNDVKNQSVKLALTTRLSKAKK